MQCAITEDIEYLGHYVTKAEYYEPWNEYIHRICTETYTDSDGNTHTDTYDCSYVDNHPEQYLIYDEKGETYYVSRNTYNNVTKQLKTNPVFIDMHRHYHTKDGDMYRVTFDGNRNNLYPFVTTNSYRNKIIGSKSIFNVKEIDEKEFEELGLYDYPHVNNTDYYDQNPIIGMEVPTAVVDSFKYLNAVYGYKYQYRCYVMIFKNKDVSISYRERDFLIGGNKNELITCIGINDKQEIQWVNAFSWEDNPEISTGVKYLYTPGEKLNLMKLNRYLLNNVPNKWHRKQFSDFDYISVNLTTGYWIGLTIITVIVNIILSIIVVKNEYQNKRKVILNMFD